MTDKNNSFETVELIKPVSLMGIDGSDLTDVKAEAKTEEKTIEETVAKSAQVPAKADSKIADNAVINTKTDAGNKVDYSLEQSIHDENIGNSAQNTQKIIVDPKKLFGESPASGEKQDYQKHNYAARFFIICVIGLILLFTIITVRSFKDKVEQTDSYSNYNTMLVAPVYTEIEFNADDIDLDLPFIISHKCIEYTDSYNRILFFTATPTEENIGTLIRVEMLDRHGHSLGTHSNSNFGVAKGNEYMIMVFFPLSPEYDLDGVTYKITADTFTEEEHAMLRTITDVTEADKGHFYITYESSAYYNMDTYVVLYKNGKVVDVLRGYGEVDDTGKAVAELYKEGVDYDNYKVYY